MSIKSRIRAHMAQIFVIPGLLLVAAPVQGRVLDDFNDNTKTSWTDFTFIPGFGLPSETGGQFKFVMPAAGQDIFSASQKVSENLELKDGRTIELRVDLAEGSGEDAFAVLAWIPNTGGNSPGTLAGYGLAKDPTNVLITKGIQKYFVDDEGVTAQLKQSNVTLVLTLSAKGGIVTVTGKILDKENKDAVLWQRTITDTAGADLMENGTDSPAAPYITSGYFTLYCYQQFNAGISSYEVTYDNAEIYVMDEIAIDDFNDNTKTSWSDFTFIPGFGLPSETGGQFKFVMPAAGQDIFTASQKVSRSIDLVEGERVELQVDLASGSGEDAYAVLAFIPNTGGNSPGTLAGYGLAKDPTDVLITKGIQKYFVADDGVTAEVKQDNVTLVLSLTVKSGSVQVHGKILDKANNNAVLWERSVVDTVAADVMEDGTDSPAAPYITSGYFTLYCYQQFNAGISSYEVAYDNAVLRAPPQAANVAPIISEIQPTEFRNFLPASTVISFKVTDDKAIDENLLAVELNGTNYTKANGLSVTGSGTTRTATLGGLATDVNYSARLRASDAEGEVTERQLYFDTFSQSHFIVEVEDYNFSSGQFFNNPVPVPAGSSGANAYSMQVGTPEVDYQDTRTGPGGLNNSPYRWDDNVRGQRSRDFERAKFSAAGGAAAEVYDYDVTDIAADEWLNYTRTFAAGTYEVYLRQGMANMATGESLLEQVTSNPAQPGQTTRTLGSFLGELTGFQYRNFPLTDATGKKVVLRLSGTTTLRLKQVTPDAEGAARFQNYLLFLPVPDPGVQRATVTTVTPASGSTTTSVRPAIEVVIENRETSVLINTVTLEVNGLTVAATVTPTATGAKATYALSPLPPTGSQVNARVTFKDNQDTSITNDWSFTLAYLRLDPALRQSVAGKTRGFNVRVVQAPIGSGLANSLQRAEDQLAPNSTIPKAYDTNLVSQLINYSQVEGGGDGNFPNDVLVPGVDEMLNGTDDIAMEVTTYLELPAGPVQLATVSDDGYKVTVVSKFEPANANEPALAFKNGGPPNAAEQAYSFIVEQAGIYAFRLVWYERGGGAHVEWSVQDLDTSNRVLINDATTAIKAWSAVEVVVPPSVQSPTLAGGNITITWSNGGTLYSAPAVTGPWTTTGDSDGSFTEPAVGTKFYRVQR